MSGLIGATPPATPGLLQLLWLASPALPIGAFSYSEVLESAIDSGLVRNEEEAGDWLHDQMMLGLGRGELPLLAASVRAWRIGDHEQIRALNDWALQTRESAELRRQAEQMGRSLRDWARSFQTSGAPGPQSAAAADLAEAGLEPPSYPVACAAVAARTQASESDILSAYAFGWSENLIQAAVKSIPLGQTAGQRLLARLCEAIPDLVQTALAMDDHDRQSFTPLLGILSCWHEVQYSRLFRS